jgi:hypothetical protein
LPQHYSVGSGAKSRPRLQSMKLFALLLTALLLAACQSPPAEIHFEPRAEPSARVNKKEPATPRARLAVRGGPRTKPAMLLAVSGLRRLHLWQTLSGRLTRLLIRARPGVRAVPDDRHLADSLYRPMKSGKGRFCRVTFYPRAMRDDLERQRFYHSEGRMPQEPPSLDEFWVAILGHELAHCRDHRRTEKAALRVEHRVLRLLRAGGR